MRKEVEMRREIEMRKEIEATHATANNHLAKANRASHGPSMRAKERVRRVRENRKVPKVRTRVKLQTLVHQVLKNQKSETSSETRESAQTYPTDTS